MPGSDVCGAAWASFHTVGSPIMPAFVSARFPCVGVVGRWARPTEGVGQALTKYGLRKLPGSLK